MPHLCLREPPNLPVEHLILILSPLGLPYTCYLYVAMDIHSRYKVGLILPQLDEGGALRPLYHATQQFPFPLRYVQGTTDWSFSSAFTPSVPSSAWGPQEPAQRQRRDGTKPPR